MGLRKFFRNLYMLKKVDLKKIENQLKNLDPEIIYADMNAMMDNVVYELPEHLQAIAKPKIKNFDDTIDALLNSDSCFCRFGDGELLIMSGGGIGFQKSNPTLAGRLRHIVSSKCDTIFIGINYQYYYADLSNFFDYGKLVYRTRIPAIRDYLNTLLIPEKQYYAAGITSAYILYKEYNFELHFSKLKKLWENREIVVICGERVFYRIEYNIFDNAESIKYQYAPTINAFDNYEYILNEAKKHSKDKLIICILGPTAKVLTYDLAMCGYRVLDLGHLAKDYNAYRKNLPKSKETICDFFGSD